MSATEGLTVLGATVRHAIPHVEAFPAPAGLTVVRASTDELASMCPVTEQPDLVAASAEVAAATAGAGAVQRQGRIEGLQGVLAGGAAIASGVVLRTAGYGTLNLIALAMVVMIVLTVARPASAAPSPRPAETARPADGATDAGDRVGYSTIVSR